MTKIELDKYYTSDELAKYCVEKAIEVIGDKNITEFLEPSAGNGVFLKYLNKPYLAYDIEPEGEEIIKQDFLELKLDYKEGRCVIGNPPFGIRMNLAQKFFKKSVMVSDYIAFILPISQLYNTNTLYEFDLVYSEDLGKRAYSGRKLHCCFNIYKRPLNNKLNKKPKRKLKDIEIIRQDSKKYSEVNNYDLRMCYWGDGSAGKILKEGENYSAEYKIIIHNNELREKIIETLSNVDWKKELNCIAMLKIQQFHIINVLKKYIHEIE